MRDGLPVDEERERMEKERARAEKLKARAAFPFFSEESDCVKSVEEIEKTALFAVRPRDLSLSLSLSLSLPLSLSLFVSFFLF